jgi:hypothetical protein
MRRTLLFVAATTILAGCTAFSGDDASDKAENKVTVVETKHVDLSCAPTSAREAGPYAEVNRISIDLVNNRIDLFSKAQIWQFHAIKDKKAVDTSDIRIAYLGRDIAAWGVRERTPFTFYFSPAKSSVAMTYIKMGAPNAVIFKCS